ncbi:MAG: response regulator, partial [Calditerrivibrio sp.]|nr:response regulator [Calditerrivibrio sp.]
MLISSEFLKDLNVLVVDDDRISVEIIRRHLLDVFKTVDVAYDGIMGLSTFLKNSYDVVVTDLYMPEMDGIGLITQIRKLDPEIPIVVVTSADGGNELKELLNLGVSRFLQKPFSKNTLVPVITDACSKVILGKRLLKEKEMEIELLKYREIYSVNQQKAAYRKEVNLLLNDLAKKRVSNGKVDYLFNSFYKPVEILCGDIYSYRFVSEDIIFGFILDTMGKGLSAAVTSVLSVAFLNHSVDRAMEHNDFNFMKTAESFLGYIKKILLEEEMLSASFFIIDIKKELLSYIHCGMPTILIKNKDGNIVELD